jgi:hypothetical protein
VIPFLKQVMNNFRTDMIACVNDTLMEMQNIVYVLTVHTSLNVILLVHIEGSGFGISGP